MLNMDYITQYKRYNEVHFEHHDVLARSIEMLKPSQVDVSELDTVHDLVVAALLFVQGKGDVDELRWQAAKVVEEMALFSDNMANASQDLLDDVINDAHYGYRND